MNILKNKLYILLSSTFLLFVCTLINLPAYAWRTDSQTQSSVNVITVGPEIVEDTQSDTSDNEATVASEEQTTTASAIVEDTTENAETTELEETSADSTVAETDTTDEIVSENTETTNSEEQITDEAEDIAEQSELEDIPAVVDETPTVEEEIIETVNTNDENLS